MRRIIALFLLCIVLLLNMIPSGARAEQKELTREQRISQKLDEAINEMTEEAKKIIDEKYWVDIEDCAVYSLGEEMNGGEFCKSVISEDSCLVDFNYLDAVSIETSEEYNKLQKLQISSRRKRKE